MTTRKQQEDLAIRLVLAVKRLRARLRETWPSPVQSLPTTQLAILKRLRDDGRTTAAALAVAEHVSQQAISQQVAILRAAGLVKTAPDRKDARKIMINITRRGLELFDAVAHSRNAWLMRAIAEKVPAREHAMLGKAIDLLERLASAEVYAD